MPLLGEGEDDWESQCALFAVTKEVEAKNTCIEQLEDKLIDITEKRDEYKQLYESLLEQSDQITAEIRDFGIVKRKISNQEEELTTL